MSLPRIAFATYERIPHLTDDDRLAADALARAGAEVEPAVWSDPGLAWSSFDLVILRSCWDYHRREREFHRWLDGLEAEGVALWNPPLLVRWNMDKSYLRELGDLGVEVVPTERVSRGRRLDLAPLLARRGWDEVVVKPAVSASAWGTWRASRSTAREADERATRQLRETSLLVQPFVPEVATEGEWSLLFFGGRFSHAVIKRPKPGDFRVQADHGGSAEAASPPPRLLAAAEHALSRVPWPWVYARVDGVESGGRFLLMELEMIEPFLFLAHAPHAPEAFAAAVLGRLKTRLQLREASQTA